MTASALDFDAAYRKHWPWLQGWLRHRTRCPDLAADLAQDTFCRLLERQGHDLPRNMRAFLAVVARSVLIDDRRRKRIERLYLEELQSLGATADQFTPERIAEAIAELAAILNILSSLPEQVRNAFLLRRIDGLTHAEVASRLGVCDRTVKRHIARAYAHCYALTYCA